MNGTPSRESPTTRALSVGLCSPHLGHCTRRAKHTFRQRLLGHVLGKRPFRRSVLRTGQVKPPKTGRFIRLNGRYGRKGCVSFFLEDGGSFFSTAGIRDIVVFGLVSHDKLWPWRCKEKTHAPSDLPFSWPVPVTISYPLK